MKISWNKTLLMVAILSMGLPALIGNRAFAISEFKLTADEPAAWDRFGYSVSISGDRVVVGAFGDDNASGSAYVFSYDGDAWDQGVKLPGDPEEGDFFGTSVSISGDRVVVGAPGDDGGRGSAYVFSYDYDESAWVEEGPKLIPSDGATGDFFGDSVSISGDRVVVGAPYDDDAGSASGSAYVFRDDGSGWVEEEPKLTADDGEAGDFFGTSVSISGDRVVVGAYGDDDASGSAYVFGYDYDESAWVEEAKLTADEPAAWDSFGFSVSISDDRVVVGAYGDDDDSGSAYVFSYDGGAWGEEEPKLTASDGAERDLFGFSVSISGNRVVVGSPFDEDAGTASGSAYVFTYYEEYKEVAVDIKPGCCPNPIELKSRKVLPVAILGSETFDVKTIDVSSIILSRDGNGEGVEPICWSYQDVSTPFEREPCDCHKLGPDGYEDLTLKFRNGQVVKAMGNVKVGDEVVLTIRGTLPDGTEIEGRDCVKVTRDKCFIRTAARGSRMAKKVEIFRKVRDKHLLTTELGRLFVSAYYKCSPPLADWIAKHPAMRKIVRVGLYPAFGLSKWFVGEKPSE